jgi:2'-5' RNA ligase
MLRLFVGLGMPDGVAARLSIMCAGVPGATWVEPANLHLTLRFIGEVEEQDAEEIDALLAGVEAPAFSIELAGVNTFGEGAKARSIHASVVPSAELAHLQAKIESAVVRAGRPPETRKFTPHVTLARLHKPQAPRLAAFLEGNAIFQAGPFRIDQFTLYESRLGKGSAVYIPLVDYPLT